MTTTNPITGDKLITKSATQQYLDNWEKIFGVKTSANWRDETKQTEEPDELRTDAQQLHCNQAT